MVFGGWDESAADGAVAVEGLELVVVAAEPPQVGLLGAAAVLDRDDVVDLGPPGVGAALDPTAGERFFDPAAQLDRDRALQRGDARRCW
jgi:hypothetical protein